MNTEQNQREVVTNEDLAEMIKTYSLKIENKIDALEEKTNSIVKRMDKLETTVKDHFNLIEKKWEIRMQINEDRLQIVKNVIVHDLATKVPW